MSRTTVRARLHRLARRDRAGGRRSAHADRADRPALQRHPRQDRELGPAQAGLRDRPSPRGHLRRRNHHRLGRADEGNRSPPARDRSGHPPPHRARRRGAARRRAHARRAQDDVGAPPRRARPAARAAAGRRRAAIGRRQDDDRGTAWRSSDERKNEEAAAAAATRTRRTARASERPRGGFFRRRRVCKFCAEKIDYINYKDVRLLAPFMPERGKIQPRRISGTCAMHQRKLQIGDQARAPARADPVRDGLGREHGSHSQRTRRQPRPPRRRREGRRRLRAQLPVAAQARAARHRGNKRQIERERRTPSARSRREVAGAKRSRSGWRASTSTIARRVGENDTLYGSVTSADIAARAAREGLRDRQAQDQLADPLKALGEFTVPVKVHRDVTAPVKVKVVEGIRFKKTDRRNRSASHVIGLAGASVPFRLQLLPHGRRRSSPNGRFRTTSKPRNPFSAPS